MNVLIVDDQRSNLVLLAKLVENLGGCTSHPFADPLKALLVAHTRSFDLVVVDYRMPEMDGITFVRALRQLPRHADVPVVMITAADERAVTHAALEAGATEFLHKPIDHIEFQYRMKNLLALRDAQNRLRHQAELLTGRVAQSVETIAEREFEIIVRLTRAAERRDNETGHHVVRVAVVCRLVAEALGLGEEACNTIYAAAPLHDVGKIGLPDSILLKPGKLTPEERREMETHTTLGHEILAGSSSPLIQAAAEIALCHHERWDGTGYPQRLAGSDIPLFARIAAVADVCDALASERPYKHAWPLEEVRTYFVQEAGRQFDPACTDAILARWTEVSGLYGSKETLAA